MALLVGSLLLAACTSSPSDQATKTNGSDIRVVAAENEYGNVASQIGGRYVSVTSVESNPNTDPHTYEVSPGVAQAVSSAQLVIQNGVGYDDFMTKIESASANPKRQVINVQHLLGTTRLHLESSPLVQPDDDAQSGNGSGGRPLHLATDPCRLLQSPSDDIHGVAASVAGGHRSFQSDLPEHDRGHDRTGRRLHVGGGGHGQSDALPIPGGHHERCRSRLHRT